MVLVPLEAAGLLPRYHIVDVVLSAATSIAILWQVSAQMETILYRRLKGRGKVRWRPCGFLRDGGQMRDEAGSGNHGWRNISRSMTASNRDGTPFPIVDVCVTKHFGRVYDAEAVENGGNRARGIGPFRGESSWSLSSLATARCCEAPTDPNKCKSTGVRYEAEDVVLNCMLIEPAHVISCGGRVNTTHNSSIKLLIASAVLQWGCVEPRCRAYSQPVDASIPRRWN